jgi:hypothetical protein
MIVGKPDLTALSKSTTLEVITKYNNFETRKGGSLET